MTETKTFAHTCSHCGASETVALDDTWQAAGAETITKKKLFGTQKVAKLTFEKEIECPSCHAVATGRITAEMKLG